MDSKKETTLVVSAGEVATEQEEKTSTKTKKEKIKREKPIDAGKRKKTVKIIRNCIIVLLIAALLFGVYKFVHREDEEVSAAIISAQAVTRGDVVVNLTGSGMIEAMDSYDIVAKVQGDILSAPFEEGQIVKEDAMLYVFDSSDAQKSLRSQQNSYDSQQISYETEQKKLENFTVKAPVSGYVQDIDASLGIGDEVSAGMQLATVNRKTVEVTLPFPVSAAEVVKVGAAARLSSAKYMTNDIHGTVTAVDSVVASDFNATISFENPGKFVEGDELAASVEGVVSSGTGFCRMAEAVTAKMKGEIAQIHVKNGDYVAEGSVLFTLEDEDARNSLRQSEINHENAGISLEKAYDALEDYTIKAPITGTVIQKNYKAGDTLGNMSNSAVLATIADISKMKFTINVDELDIPKVELGQRVEVVADAIENKVFDGEITKIIQQGTGTSGVTTFPVEVTIAEPGELKIGMNVTGTIMVSSAKNVVKVPLEAVSVRGGKTFVQVLKDEVREKAFGDSAPAQQDAPKGEKMQRPQMNGEGQRLEMPTDMKGGAQPKSDIAQAPKTGAEAKKGEAVPKNTGKKEAYVFTDADFEMREVTTGVSSDDEIEIISGLEVGEYVKVVQTVNNRATITMPGAMGGMGGMGGMSGGMPGGMGGQRSGGMGGQRTGGMAGGR